MPADDLYPETFAEEAATIAGRVGLEIEIWDKARLNENDVKRCLLSPEAVPVHLALFFCVTEVLDVITLRLRLRSLARVLPSIPAAYL